MNAPLIAVPSGPSHPKLETYAKLRSLCVDAFARLEYSVIVLCKSVRLDFSSRALLGQRLKKLREPDVLILFCESKRTDIQKLLDRAEVLLRQRTDIVHSEMELASTDIETLALFRNSADRAENNPEARVYSISTLRLLSQEVRSIAAEFEAITPPRRSEPLKIQGS